MIQNGYSTDIHSYKLTLEKINYTTTEIELLSIVKTLKESHTIILGHGIALYMDHKNIMYENFTTERVIRRRFLL